MALNSLATLTNGVYPENTLKFNSCKIEFIGNTQTAIINRGPKELIMDNCDVHFATTPYVPLSMKNDWDSKLIINNCRLMWDDMASYIIDFGAANYTVYIYNSEFSESRSFGCCSSSGTTGGIIRVLNNIMSNINTYNANNFEIIGTNDISNL